jgi:hypothetical protein
MTEAELLDRPLPSVLHAKFGNPLNPLVRAFVSVIIVGLAIGFHLALPWLIASVVVMYLVIFMRQGRLIDIQHHRTKRYTGPYPLQWGRWHPFGAPTEVMVSRNSRRSGGMHVMMTYDSSEVFYDVDLVLDEQQFLTAMRTANYQEAIKLGQQLMDHFDKPLNDIAKAET